MARYPYHLVDVFTEQRFGGNPLAVFLDAERIPEALYQPIAKELNLSETTFVLPSADTANHFRVRIFTTGFELPMAGHPTVGTAYVLARTGRFDAARAGGVLRFEEGVGLVPVTVEPGDAAPGLITMQQPLPTFGETFADRAAVAATLSLEPGDLLPDAPVQVVSCGVPFWFVGLRGLAAIRRLRVRSDLWERHFGASSSQMLFAFTLETEHPQARVHSRMIGIDLGGMEDPATGSANGPLGCYLVRHGLVPAAPQVALVSEQGIEIGRPSFLHITIHTQGADITGVHVGGRCVPMGEGVLEL
ncbi:MAG TPA: PhzF family phenazine biosynthesis protein [bacterium]|nr:PhzF family phenazine biosynthesis protein [bacterium]